MQAQTPSGLGRALLSFAAALLLGQIVLTGIGALFPEFDMPSSMGLILMLAAAMTGGQSFARHTHRVMTMGEKLRFALIATALGVVLSGVLLAATFAWYGVPMTLDTLSFSMTGDMRLAADLRPWLWAVLAGAAAVSALVCFIAVGFGAKGVVRAQEKAASR